MPLRHPGADWRNLRNESIVLQSGLVVGPLLYMSDFFLDAGAAALPRTQLGTGQRAAQARGGALPPHLAVCACQIAASPAERERLRGAHVCRRFEVSHLVPWMGPHSGCANNDWAGMCARPSGGASAGALITGTSLSCKQGAVLHYEQPGRVFSAREVARMDGIGDGFRLGVDEAVEAASAASEACSAARVHRAAGNRMAAGDDAVTGAGELSCEGYCAPGCADAVATGRIDGVVRAIATAYHAVGNAVPFPLGVALAREVARSMAVA